jgi:hypothetical protein
LENVGITGVFVALIGFSIFCVWIANRPYL